jgi:hypothetical protein
MTQTPAELHEILVSQLGRPFADFFLRSQERYSEISHLRETLFAEATPKESGRTRYTVRGVALDPSLSDNDYLMLVEGGPVPFGGVVSRIGANVAVTVNTD